MSWHDLVVVSPELDSWLRETRRYLHMHPELSLQEVNTARFVAPHLRELGIEHQTGLGGDGRPLFLSPEVLRAAGIEPGPSTGGNGILALIRGERGPGRTILLRADMDALPIDEQNEVPYRSTRPGIMHACGHDAHTTILLGVAELPAQLRDRFAGTVKLMFQPAEEGPGGAAAMINDGILDNPPVDVAVALHVDSTRRAGEVAISPPAQRRQRQIPSRSPSTVSGAMRQSPRQLSTQSWWRLILCWPSKHSLAARPTRSKPQ